MTVFYEAALLATIGICSWIALDLVFASSWRRRIASVAALATAGGLFAVGTLLLQGASEPSEVLAARRVLFLGIALLGPAWLWCALEGRSPGWTSRGKWVLAALAAPTLAMYSTLYWDTRGWFTDWVALPAEHGPLFYVNALYTWGLIGAGLWVSLHARDTALPLTSRHRILISLAVGLPLALNLVYVVAGIPGADPTPVMIGFSALALRSVVLDVVWSDNYLPFARSEVMEQMETGCIVANLHGSIVDANLAARQLFGGEALEGRSLGDVLAELRRRRFVELEAREFSLTRRGEVVGIGAVVTDRTAQRRLERQVDVATRLEALGHLGAGVAHEVNNPLAYLTANLEMLAPLIDRVAEAETRAKLPEELRILAKEAPSLLADSREGADRIDRIVDHLSTLSMRPAEKVERQPIDLRNAIGRAREMAIFGQGGATIRVRCSGRPTAFAAESDVVHILLHLLLNALRAGGEGANVEVRVEAEDEQTVVQVLDDGPGVPDSDLPYVFDPFFTTERPGRLGMGLSLCWQLARHNGGSIDVRNRSEGGAEFTLALPASEPV
jgi:signal transduction histidine kinase